MGAEHGDGAQGFEHEIAVADGVIGIARHGGEAELLRDGAEIDGQGCARQCGGAKRHDGHGGFGGGGKAAAVALESFGVAQQDMAETHGLAMLEMGGAGDDDADAALGLIREGGHERVQLAGERVEPITDIEAQRGGDEIVARAAGMHLLAEIAAAFGDVTLKMHVNIFVADCPGEAAGLDFLHRGLQCRDDAADIFRRKQAGKGGQAVQPCGLHRHFLPGQAFILRNAVGEGEEGVGLGFVAF